MESNTNIKSQSQRLAEMRDVYGTLDSLGLPDTDAGIIELKIKCCDFVRTGRKLSGRIELNALLRLDRRRYIEYELKPRISSGPSVVVLRAAKDFTSSPAGRTNG